VRVLVGREAGRRRAGGTSANVVIAVKPTPNPTPFAGGAVDVHSTSNTTVSRSVPHGMDHNAKGMGSVRESADIRCFALPLLARYLLVCESPLL
jgi:hypothetical protein